MQEGSRRAIIAAFFANFGIAIAKFVGFAITGAASMLAEAVHSVADTGNQGLLLLGGARAKRAPTATHQFGYGRERYFWSFAVSLVLFSLGSLFALYEGVEKLRHPHVLESPAIAVGILALAVVFEIFSFRTAVRESNHVRGTESWWGFIRHSKSPELPVVLLEDLGALVGLVLALCGIVLAELTGEPRFDAIGSMAIGGLLGVIAVMLMIEMKSLLIGESASPEVQARIRQALESGEGVRQVIHFRTQHLGPNELLVGAKLEFDGTLDALEICERINAVERSVRESVPDARIIYLEPDVTRGPSGPSERGSRGPSGPSERETPAQPGP